MNIMEYRAMKEAEAKQQSEGANQDAQTQSTDTATQNPSPQANEGGGTQQTSGTEGTTQAGTGETKTDEPKTVTIEGLGEIPIDELAKGYLRQSDYTRKTQEIAQKARQLEKIEQLYQKVQANPERAQQLAQEFNVPVLDPQVDYVTQLQQNYYDLLLEKEIGELQAKYTDFDPQVVLPLALEEKLENLENAYLLHKARNPEPAQKQETVDINQIKEQIRQDLLRELELERNTQSIITSGNGAPVTDNQPVLSDEELRVARNMGLSPQEYAKWRG